MMLMAKVAAVAGIPMAMAAGAVATTQWVVVDVTEGGPAGHRIWVPVPMGLARTAMAFAPDEARRVEIPAEAAECLPMVREVLAALAEAPDAELVRVEDGRETVLIRKEGDLLQIRISGRDEEVAVDVPLDVAQDVLDAFEGNTFHTARAVAALGGLRNADLVDVTSGGDHVRVWVW